MNENWFFLSYARLDRETDKHKCIERFFEDLNQRVRAMKKVREEYAGFFDSEGIETGEMWPQSLGHGLSSCRVLVCLYSPAYFASEYCGKEWAVFASRVRAAHPDKPPLILPVLLYAPEDVLPLPPPVADVQYVSDNYPETYRREGLRYLMVRDSQKENYEDFLDACVRQLLDVADAHPLPPLEVLPDIKRVASFFKAPGKDDDAPTPVAVGPRYAEFIYVAARREEVEELVDKGLNTERYGEEGQLDWKPYLPPDEAEQAQEISIYAQTVASREQFRYQPVPLGNDLVEHISEAQRNNRLVVIIVDTWTLCLDRYRQIMTEFDSALFYNTVTIVAWNKDASTPASRQLLSQNLKAAFTTKFILKDERVFIDRISTATELENSLGVALQRLKLQVIDAIQSFRQIDAGPIILKPDISGPGRDA